MACGNPLSMAAALLATGVLSAVAGNCGETLARIEAIEDPALSRAAIRAIASECELEHVARNSKSWRNRSYATYNLMRESTRRDIFDKDPDWHVKAAALFRSADAGFIERVACDEGEQDRLRYVAIMKLRNRDVLERLKSSQCKLVRDTAARLLPAFKEATEVPMPMASFTDIESITRH